MDGLGIISKNYMTLCELLPAQMVEERRQYSSESMLVHFSQHNGLMQSRVNFDTTNKMS